MYFAKPQTGLVYKVGRHEEFFDPSSYPQIANCGLSYHFWTDQG